MAKTSTFTAGTLDDFLKSLLVFSRTIQHVLETTTVEKTVGQPLSPSKVQILRLLGRCKSQTSTQVARYLGVTKPAVSQIIDSMVRAKMVARKPTKHDRREVALELTAQGLKHFRSIRKGQHQVLRTVARKAKQSNLKRWSKDLTAITTAMAQSSGAAEELCLQCGSFEDSTCIHEGHDKTCAFVLHANGALKKQAAKKKRR